MSGVRSESSEPDATEKLRRRVTAEVASYKRGLADWAALNTYRGDAQFVTLAMLETAIERQIDAMGEADARESIETMFRHVAALRTGRGHA